jgi:hypothetical protein
VAVRQITAEIQCFLNEHEIHLCSQRGGQRK